MSFDRFSAWLRDGRLEALPDPVLQPLHALGDHAGEVALPGAEHLGDGLQPAGHLGLDAGDLGDLVVHLARPLGRGAGLERALAARAQEQDGYDHAAARGRAPRRRASPRPR